MLRPRIIPCLLVKDKGLVKTVRFSDPKYVGDPINAVKIFNEKEVDELIVVDIDVTVGGTQPDYTMIRHIAAECRMPLCYGGGIGSVAQAKTIIGLGVEKVALSAAAIRDPGILAAIAEGIGSQSVVVVLDAKRSRFGAKYELFTHNGTVATGRDPVQFAQLAARHGVGEIVINSIDNDGTMRGYDFELIRRVRDAVQIPLTVLGGAGSLQDVGAVIREFGVIGVAAGSLFVFKGAYRAVLISYPSSTEKDNLIAAAGRRA